MNLMKTSSLILGILCLSHPASAKGSLGDDILICPQSEPDAENITWSLLPDSTNKWVGSATGGVSGFKTTRPVTSQTKPEGITFVRAYLNDPKTLECVYRGEGVGGHFGLEVKSRGGTCQLERDIKKKPIGMVCS
jgi:hypothetical protein